MHNCLVVDKVRWDCMTYVPHGIMQYLDFIVVLNHEEQTMEFLKDRYNVFYPEPVKRTWPLSRLQEALDVVAARYAV